MQARLNKKKIKTNPPPQLFGLAKSHKEREKVSLARYKERNREKRKKEGRKRRKIKKEQGDFNLILASFGHF